MSLIRKKQAENTSTEEATPMSLEAPKSLDAPQIAATTTPAAENMKTHVRRLVVSCDCKMRDLAHGSYKVSIPNAEQIFKPDFNVDKLDEETAASMKNLDFTKGIITGIEAVSVYNSGEEPVTVGLNLFQTPEGKNVCATNLEITNNQGWLYSTAKNDYGADSTIGRSGFTNLMAIMPYERSRQPQQVYNPENLINNRFIEQYGGYTLKSLWEGIVPFPNENYYYVDCNHVILKVIESNWELLGMSPLTEVKKENKYVKVSTSVVDVVCDELYKSVLSKIPFTSFNKLTANFSRPHGASLDQDKLDRDVKCVCELKVSYMYPSLQNKE